MSFHITYRRRALNQETTQRQFIESTKIEIGRGAGCDIALDDLRVSLRHASIEKSGTDYILKDLPDEYGTYVNGRSIVEYRLADRDTVQIGSSVFYIHLSSPEAPLDIAVEYAAPEMLPDSTAQAAYRANCQLASGMLTKSRLAVLGVLIILGITLLAFLNTPGTNGWWQPRVLLAPGKVSQAHSFIEQDCTQCHGTTWQQVTDTTCKTCHDGPAHHSQQAFTPSCVTCHAEHKGRQAVLTMVEDRLCTQCHAALQTRGIEQGAVLRVVGKDALEIRSFSIGHPEFAVEVRQDAEHPPARVRLREKPSDAAQLYYNHKVHLKPEKLGPEGLEQLTCSDCHRVDAQGAHMQPITYADHCMRCHRLEFDERFPKQVVPHDAPPVVRTFLVSTFTQFCLDRLLSPAIADDEGGERLRQRPGRSALPREDTLSFKQCLDDNVQAAEKLLYTRQERLDKNRQQGCGLCHVLQPPAPVSQLPVVAQTAIPQQWFPHSTFAHQVHARAGRSCEDCHRTARESEKREDVLLPNMASCQQCHAASGTASTACVSCHLYHDKDARAKSLIRYMEERFSRRTTLQSHPSPVSAPPVGR